MQTKPIRISAALVWRFVKRDWRARELRLLLLAVLVAVAAVSSVSFFADRVERAMNYQATELLAADLLLSSRKPLPPKYHQQATNQEIRNAQTVELRSVVVADNDELVMAELKAVSVAYPLYGRLKISDAAYSETVVADSVPATGEVWVDQELLNKLKIAVDDRLQVGEVYFRITKILQYEPDRGGSLYQLGPRVLMNIDDLSGTGLVGPLSLVFYKSLFAGSNNQVDQFKNWLDENIQPGIRIQTVENARPEIRRALQRARQFLSLAVVITVIVASVAIAVVANHFSQRQAINSALFKCFGATQAFISRFYLYRMLLLAVLGGVLGCIGGYLMQAVIANILANWFVIELPAAGLTPWAIGMLTALVVLLGFALPPIMRLKTVPPLRVIRHDMGIPNLSAVLTLFTALLAISMVIAGLAQETRMAVIALLGVFATITVSAILAWLLLRFLQKIPRRGLVWRYGLSAILRHQRYSILQLVAFSLSMMAILLLTFIRVDILEKWQLSLPQDTPNHFLINVQPEEQDALQTLFQQQGWPPPQMGPVVVARLTGINGKAISAEDYEKGSRAQWIVQRDQRLSYAPTLSQSNEIYQGKFWQPNDEQPQWSFERSYAEGLDLTVGDVVEFRVGDSVAQAPITSLRDVAWDSMQINFFVMANPAFLQSYPTTFLSSFYLPPDRSDFVRQITRQFPGVTVIDVSAIIGQVREIADRASMAIEYIFLFTLCACLLVLYASIQASRDIRLQEVALLRTLGLVRRQISFSFAVEFGIIGLLAGGVAVIMATTAAYFIADQVFNISYTLNLPLIVISLFSAVGIILAAGILGTRSLLSSPPMRALAEFQAQ